MIINKYRNYIIADYLDSKNQVKQCKLKKSFLFFKYFKLHFGYWINKSHFDKLIHIVWFEFRVGRFAIDIEFNTNRKYYFYFYPFYK